MTDYFQKNESEEFDMVNFKWDQKRALEVAMEDGEARGEARGKRNAMKEVTLKLLKRGIPLGIITDSTQLSPEEIRQIAKDNGLAF